MFLPTYLPASVTPSPSAPPVRLCPPLCSPEDANINLFTAAGLLSYIQSTTRRAYQQVLEVLDDSHRRYVFSLFISFWLNLLQIFALRKIVKETDDCCGEIQEKVMSMSFLLKEVTFKTLIRHTPDVLTCVHPPLFNV